jgi:hypothetical protein
VTIKTRPSWDLMFSSVSGGVGGKNKEYVFPIVASV